MRNVILRRISQAVVALGMLALNINWNIVSTGADNINWN